MPTGDKNSRNGRSEQVKRPKAESDQPFVKVSVGLRDRLHELDDSEVRVLLSLGLRINKERQCWPAVDILAKESCRSTRQVQRTIKSLFDKRFIWIARRVGGRGKTTLYTLNGYFAYGQEPLQLMAPFMDETLTPMSPFTDETPTPVSPFDEKGDIAANEKGDTSDAKRVTLAEADQIRKKNHGRRTIEEEEDFKNAGALLKDNISKVFAGLQQRRGYKSASAAAEAKSIKWMINQGYMPEVQLACFDALKGEPFWSDKPLSMMSVAKEIGEFVKRNMTPREGQDGATRRHAGKTQGPDKRHRGRAPEFYEELERRYEGEGNT